MRAYYDRYRNRNASTADFRRVMEDVSGQPLDWFFEQWTRRAGHPVVEGTWRYDEAAGTCEVTLRQVQEAPPFRVPVTVALTGARGQTTTLALNSRSHSAQMNCPEAPTSVSLDPETQVLAEWSMEQAE
jgi:aminopeptidase N